MIVAPELAALKAKEQLASMNAAAPLSAFGIAGIP